MKDIIRPGIIAVVGVLLIFWSANSVRWIKDPLFLNLEEDPIKEREIYQGDNSVSLRVEGIPLRAIHCQPVISFKVEEIPYRLVFLTKHFINHSPPLLV